MFSLRFFSFCSGLTSEDDFSWSDTPWQKRRNPPGLSRSLCSKLYQASRQTTETLKVALQMITESHDNSDDERLREVESNNGDAMEDFASSDCGDPAPISGTLVHIKLVLGLASILSLFFVLD